MIVAVIHDSISVPWTNATRSRILHMTNFVTVTYIPVTESLQVSIMSGATPTLIPRKALYPRILPHPPVPHAIPMPLPRRRWYRTLNTFRNIFNEMDDLSDEENELDDEVSSTPTFLHHNPELLILSRSKTSPNADSTSSSQ